MSQHQPTQTHANQPQADGSPECGSQAAPATSTCTVGATEGSSEVLARVPDLNAESPTPPSSESPQLRVDTAHQQGSGIVASRLISQVLSARILFGVAAVLLVIAISAPLFLGGDESAESSGEGDSWKPAAPAPEAADAPQWGATAENASPWPQSQPSGPEADCPVPESAAPEWQTPSAGQPEGHGTPSQSWSGEQGSPLAGSASPGPAAAPRASHAAAPSWQSPQPAPYPSTDANHTYPNHQAAGAPTGEPSAPYANTGTGRSDYQADNAPPYADAQPAGYESRPAATNQNVAPYDSGYAPQYQASASPGAAGNPRAEGYPPRGYQAEPPAGPADRYSTGSTVANQAAALDGRNREPYGIRQASVPADYRQAQYRNGYSRAAGRYERPSRYAAQANAPATTADRGYQTDYSQSSPPKQQGPSTTYPSSTNYQQPASYQQPEAYDRPNGDRYAPPPQAAPSSRGYPQTSSGSTNEPGVAQFEGVIEKPTVRTTYDRARSSFH